MPRNDLLKGRVSLPGQIYHITICTDQRRPWFESLEYSRLVILQMRKMHEEKMLYSMAWVLMPDHLHWLLQLTGNNELSAVIKRFKGSAARALNKKLGRSGSIWQRGFHDHALRHEEDIRQTARYIVANPLRAGIVESIGAYPHWDAIWM